MKKNVKSYKITDKGKKVNQSPNINYLHRARRRGEIILRYFNHSGGREGCLNERQELNGNKKKSKFRRGKV